jgi:hypothetical protein
MLAFQVWPVLYTAATAFTNQGNGHMLTKEQAIDTIVGNSVREVPDTPRYAMAVAVPDGVDAATGDLVLLLTDPTDGTMYVGTEEGLKELTDSDIEQNDKGAVKSAPGYTILNAKQVGERADLKDIFVPTEKGAIKPQGLSQAFEGTPTMTYDADADVMTDETTGIRYVAEEGSFVPESGTGGVPESGTRLRVPESGTGKEQTIEQTSVGRARPIAGKAVTADTGKKSSASKASASKGSRLPADWQLPKAWGEWALQEAPTWAPEQVRKVAERFRDYWIAKPGREGFKADWLATWRNWVRREAERTSAAPARGQPVGAADPFRGAL